MGMRADETKAAILQAAIAEFSEHGIAGARVERITTAAGANQALLFRYFGNKARLFDAAFEALATATLNDVPIDTDDLPGWAGRLFDFYAAHPAMVRLAAWYQLERSDDKLPPEVVESTAAKVALLKQAQLDGRISASLPPDQLLDMILHLSVAGTRLTPILAPADAHTPQSRAAVVRAVRSLVTPPPVATSP